LPRLIRLLVGIGAVLLAVLLVLLTTDAPSKGEVGCIDIEIKDTLRSLASDGIDKAYMNHVSLLFDIWVKDPADQPKRAITGMQAAISAYIRARGYITAWDPPAC
jgi:hypothetical protein